MALLGYSLLVLILIVSTIMALAAKNLVRAGNVVLYARCALRGRIRVERGRGADQRFVHRCHQPDRIDGSAIP